MPENRRELPNFKSYEEAVEFFDTHSISDYWDEMEEVEMEPFIEDHNFEGKKVALFGSYDWGDGQWMRDWEERMQSEKKAEVFGEGLMIHLTPDDSGIEECRSLGSDFASK